MSGLPTTVLAFRLPATDGYSLAAELHAPQDAEVRASLLVNAGGGVPMRVYRGFAAYAATQGLATLVYDYRGIGHSAPASFAGFDASIEDWGAKDATAALRWLKARYPGQALHVLAHSIGCVVTGLSENLDIERALFVSGHTAYHGDYAWWAWPGMYLMWHELMPWLVHRCGYFPGKRLGLEDIPAGVALEWAGRRSPQPWAELRTPWGTPDHARAADVLRRFSQLGAVVLALRASGDPFATVAATRRVLGLYPNIEAQVRGIGSPSGRPLGHFGFFRRRHAAALWPDALRWLVPWWHFPP